uniref:F-box domain-containing protein n=1 Tax=Tetradesmus obliquus TaxID=3088 RepID=A0A383VEK7_TETOB
MDKLREVLQLCFPLLTPTDMFKLQRTCRELRDMRVSWQGHSIDFHVNESVSALSWLHKNIGSMWWLNLTISVVLPRSMLQQVMEAGRWAAASSCSSSSSKQQAPQPEQATAMASVPHRP